MLKIEYTISAKSTKESVMRKYAFLALFTAAALSGCMAVPVQRTVYITPSTAPATAAPSVVYSAPVYIAPYPYYYYGPPATFYFRYHHHRGRR